MTNPKIRFYYELISGVEYSEITIIGKIINSSQDSYLGIEQNSNSFYTWWFINNDLKILSNILTFSTSSNNIMYSLAQKMILENILNLETNTLFKYSDGEDFIQVLKIPYEEMSFNNLEMWSIYSEEEFKHKYEFSKEGLMNWLLDKINQKGINHLDNIEKEILQLIT